MTAPAGVDAPRTSVARGPLARTWAGVVLISFSAVFVRLADVEPARSAFLRCAYALPAFALLVLWRRGRGDRSDTIGPLAVFAGVLLGFDLLTWHLSIEVMGAGVATVLPNVQVIIVGVVGVLAFRERPLPAFWLALPVILGGVWLLGATGRSIEPGASVAVGVAYGMLSAVFYAGYLVLLRVARLGRPDVGAVGVMTAATLGAALVNGVSAAVQGVAGPVGDVERDGWLVALALGCQVLGWTLLASSIHRLPAALTSVTLLVQPVLTLVWGATLLDEPIGRAQALGSAIVLAGVYAAHRAVVAGTKRSAEAERIAAIS